MANRVLQKTGLDLVLPPQKKDPGVNNPPGSSIYKQHVIPG